MTSGRRQARPDPPTDIDLPQWFGLGAAALVDALTAAAPEDPCWGLGAAPEKAFWFRRQAHETTVHRHDAQEAVGEAAAIDPVLAADGIDELLTVMLPRAAERFGDPPRLPAPLLLHATDTGHRWLLDPDPGDHGPGVSRPDRDAPPAAARLSGPADRLLLSLWRRVDPGAAVTVDGDPAVVDALWAGRLTT